MKQHNGYTEFAANDDWWPEDRVTAALRTARPAREIPKPTREERYRALTAIMESPKSDEHMRAAAKSIRDTL